jgi:hypothetical protein
MGDVRGSEFDAEDLQTSSIHSDKQVPGLEKVFCTERAYREPAFIGNWAEEETEHRSIKRLENIADNASGQDSVEGCFTGPPHKNPAKTHVFTDSCTEPVKQRT